MEKQVIFERDIRATLCGSGESSAPLILLNSYEEEGESILSALKEMGAPACSLLVISRLKWNHDLSPWPAPPLFREEEPFTGGADEYLALILQEILPRARAAVGGSPSFTGMAGYSLAGLFTLYTLYKCDAFHRAAGISGSLWYPGFREFVLKNEFRRTPDRIYLSLGDREARTRHPLMKTVQSSTEEIAAFYREQKLDVTFELNPGNHFRDEIKRTAKGIRHLLL